ncbi:hypothetical protein niasHT_033636 [Heterodera trifolii]|uniref:Uncharacterized protein n=1 Tax=Heterodera trifolii TaxID=157864 RepID=A0ABD2IJV0_9BILA
MGAAAAVQRSFEMEKLAKQTVNVQLVWQRPEVQPDEVQTNLKKAQRVSFEWLIVNKSELNEDQRITHGLFLDDESRVIFMQAPAGTGKSVSVAACIASVLKKDRAVSPLNVAVCELVKDTMESLSEKQYVDDFNRAPRRAREQSRTAAHLKQTKYRVYFMTLALAEELALDLGNVTYVLVDECGQATLSVVLSILTKFRSVKKILLTGDKQQLRVHLPSQMTVVRGKFGFESILEMLETAKRFDRTVLSKCYRSHSAIVRCLDAGVYSPAGDQLVSTVNSIQSQEAELVLVITTRSAAGRSTEASLAKKSGRLRENNRGSLPSQVWIGGFRPFTAQANVFPTTSSGHAQPPAFSHGMMIIDTSVRPPPINMIAAHTMPTPSNRPVPSTRMAPYPPQHLPSYAEAAQQSPSSTNNNRRIDVKCYIDAAKSLFKNMSDLISFFVLTILFIN